MLLFGARVGFLVVGFVVQLPIFCFSWRCGELPGPRRRSGKDG